MMAASCYLLFGCCEQQTQVTARQLVVCYVIALTELFEPNLSPA